MGRLQIYQYQIREKMNLNIIIIHICNVIQYLVHACCVKARCGIKLDFVKTKTEKKFTKHINTMVTFHMQVS